MGNCGYCDVDCLYCIEKKETKFDFISENRNKINPKKEIKFNQDKPIENTYISAIKKIKNDDITSIYSLEENTLRKKFNESHETHLDEYNQKDMSSLQILKNKLDVENKQININIENPNNKILDVDTNIKYFEEMNKEENDDDKQSNATLRYNNTNFKSSNVSFLKYFEKIEDNSKNFDMTNNNINSKRRLTEIFPIKFNYHKDKYINYFADNSI